MENGDNQNVSNSEKITSGNSSPEWFERILKENGLGEYIETFRKHKLTTKEIISELTDQDLLDIGVSLLGDRKKILLLFKDKSKTEDKIVFPDPQQPAPVTTIVEKKSGGGVWAFVGVLVAIVLIIVIAESL